MRDITQIPPHIIDDLLRREQEKEEERERERPRLYIPERPPRSNWERLPKEEEEKTEEVFYMFPS